MVMISVYACSRIALGYFDLIDKLYSHQYIVYLITYAIVRRGLSILSSFELLEESISNGEVVSFTKVYKLRSSNIPLPKSIFLYSIHFFALSNRCIQVGISPSSIA